MGEVVLGIRIKSSADPAAIKQTEADLNRLGQTTAQVNEKIRDQNRAFSATSAEMRKAAQAESLLSEEHLKLDAQLTRLRGSIDPVFARTRQLDAANTLLHQGLKQGVITQAEYQHSLGLVAQKFGQAAEGAGKSAFATAGARRELIVLGHEAMTGNFSRMPGSFMVLASRIGAVNLAAIGMGLGIAAGIGTLVYGAVKADEYQNALAGLQRQFDASGRGALVSGGQMRQMVDDMAMLPGVSRDAAEQTLAAFARVPQVSGQMFARLTGMARDFAAGMGIEMPKAAEVLAESFAHPAEGAKKLDAQLNFLSADQLLLIERLDRQGQTLEAQKVMYQALETRIRGLANHGVTPLQEATDHLNRSWESMLTSMGKSSALETVNNLLGFMVDRVDYLVNHPNFILKVAVAGPLGGMLMEHFSDDSGAAPRNVSEGKIKYREPPVKALDNSDVKKALEDNAGFLGYQGQLKKLTDSRDEINKALTILRDGGAQASATYKQLSGNLAEVNRQIANLKDPVAEKANKLREMQAEFFSEDVRSLNDKFQAEDKFIESYRDELNNVMGLEQTHAQKLQEKLDLDKKLSFEARIQAQGIIDQIALQEQLNASVAAQMETDDQQLAILLQQDDQKRKGLDLENQYATAYIEQKQELEFQVSLLQMTDKQRKLALADHRALAEAQKEINALTAEGNELDAAGMEAIRAKYLGLEHGQLLLENTNESLAKQKDTWGTIEQTAHDTWISIFDSGASVIDRLSNMLKNSILDLLYQMTIKRWIINIGAIVTGTGAAGVAAAADGLLSGGGLSSGGSGSSADIGSIGSIISNGFSLLSGSVGESIASAAGVIGGDIGQYMLGNAATLGTAVSAIGLGVAAFSLLSGGLGGLFGGGHVMRPKAYADTLVSATRVSNIDSRTTDGANADWAIKPGLELGKYLQKVTKELGGEIVKGFVIGTKYMQKYNSLEISVGKAITKSNRDLIFDMAKPEEAKGASAATFLLAVKRNLIDVDDYLKKLIKDSPALVSHGTLVLQRIFEIKALRESLEDLPTIFGHLRDQIDQMKGVRDKPLKLDPLKESIGNFYNLFYTDAEKFADNSKYLHAQLEKLNVAFPESRAAFKDYVSGLDTTTSTGLELFRSLTNLATPMSAFYDEIEKTTDASERAARAMALNADLFSNVVDFHAAKARIEAGQPVRLPQFAAGGIHTGGLRIVGEKGPELELTGPSRILANADLMKLLRGLQRERLGWLFGDSAAQRNAGLLSDFSRMQGLENYSKPADTPRAAAEKTPELRVVAPARVDSAEPQLRRLNPADNNSRMVQLMYRMVNVMERLNSSNSSENISLARHLTEIKADIKRQTNDGIIVRDVGLDGNDQVLKVAVV